MSLALDKPNLFNKPTKVLLSKLKKGGISLLAIQTLKHHFSPEVTYCPHLNLLNPLRTLIQQELHPLLPLDFCKKDRSPSASFSWREKNG
jgi:hypothetical protein